MRQLHLFIAHSDSHPEHQMQPTSLEALKTIKLDQRQKEYLDALREVGSPSTDLEVSEASGHGDPNYFRPRRNELVKMGVVVEKESRKCKVSGRYAKTWWFKYGNL